MPEIYCLEACRVKAAQVESDIDMIATFMIFARRTKHAALVNFQL